MGAGAKTCEACELMGHHSKAVKEYISIITGERTSVCGHCYRREMDTMEALKTGPYTNQTDTGIGHKGGAGEDMAKFLSGSKAAEARKVLLGVLTEPLTPEQASRKAGLDPDYGSPRISELIKKGLVVTVDRKGRSERGNICGRYIITDLAKGLAA